LAKPGCAAGNGAATIPGETLPPLDGVFRKSPDTFFARHLDVSRLKAAAQ
jgi:hypothetical protein